MLIGQRRRYGGQQQEEHDQPRRTNRYQSRLDMVPRDQTRRGASDADGDPQDSHQNTGFGSCDVQHDRVFGHDEEGDSRQKIKVTPGHHHHQQTGLRHLANRFDVGIEWVQFVLQALITYLQWRQEQRCAQPRDGNDNQDSAGQPCQPDVRVLRAKPITDQSGHQCPDDHRRIGHHVDRAVGTAQIRVGYQFRDHPILGRAEKRALTGQCDQRQQGDPKVAGVEANCGNQGNRNFRNFDPPGHRSLGVSIGKLACESRKQDKGNGETDAHDPLPTGAQASSPSTVDDHERQDSLEHVVIHRAEELSRDQA